MSGHFLFRQYLTSLALISLGCGIYVIYTFGSLALMAYKDGFSDLASISLLAGVSLGLIFFFLFIEAFILIEEVE